MSRSSEVLREILTLDAERDHQRIVFLTYCCEFPFDTNRSLSLALFRTFCVPAIGGLLDRTREFERRPQRRYDDTDIIMSEIIEHGYDSERGRRALERMNSMHGHFAIDNADFLYALSTFVYEPIRWNARFGWRRLHEKERLAMYHFWRAVGERMRIREIPASYDELESYNRAYEQAHFRPTAASHRVVAATVAMFAGWLPWPLSLLVPGAMRAVMDETLLRALNLPPPSRGLCCLAETALRWRGRVAHAWARGRPTFRTEGNRYRSYPCGYDLAQVGPPSEPPKNCS